MLSQIWTDSQKINILLFLNALQTIWLVFIMLRQAAKK